MNAKYFIIMGMVVMQMSSSNVIDFRKLLIYNLAQKDIASLCNVDYELLLYSQALKDEG